MRVIHLISFCRVTNYNKHNPTSLSSHSEVQGRLCRAFFLFSPIYLVFLVSVFYVLIRIWSINMHKNKKIVRTANEERVCVLLSLGPFFDGATVPVPGYIFSCCDTLASETT